MGPNVDVIGGPVVKQHPWQGDPGGQRQDEASCFVDSRNPLVVGCAFNDYTPVEIESNTGETGDAWIGQSVSTDGGATWRKFLFPGYPQQCETQPGVSSLCGLDAAADPTWRSGPNGRSYLSGIAFDRGSLSGGSGAQSNGVVFVQAYVNNNNIQNDPNPLKPDPAINNGQPVIIDTGNTGQFQDKTWLGVGPDGKVYVTYATFVGGSLPHSTIYVQVSSDGGKTFTRSKLSEGEKVSNGTIITTHADKPCWVDVSWRRRKTALSPTETDAIQFVRSTDCGKSWTSPTTIVSLTDMVRADGSTIGRLFDQGTGKYFFRNISNPAMASGPDGTTYVAWAERLQSQDPTYPNTLITRDSHIKLTVGTPAKTNGNQVKWATPILVDQLTGAGTVPRGHQIRPSMWFASGKLYLSAAFLQEDQTGGVFTRQQLCDPGKTGQPPCDPINPDATPKLTITTYIESREPKGELLPSPATATQVGRAFTESIIDLAPKNPTLDVAPTYQANLVRRHTEEIGVWQGTPGNPYPSFTFAKVTRFPMRQRHDDNGDAIPHVFESVGGNSWTIPLHCKGSCAFAGDYDDMVAQAFVPNGSGGYVPNVAASTQTPAYVAWTDNRFVHPITDMTKFHFADGTCGADANGPVDDTGTRNQEVLISRVGNGVYAYVMGNQKLITQTVPRRAFTVAIQNGVNATKHYHVTASQPIGITASWKQFDATQASIDISLPPFTTGARQLYVQGGNSPVRVDVVEIGGSLQTFTMVNPDSSAPGLLPPNQDGTIDPTNPNSNEIYTPDVTAPDVTAPDVTANVVVTPDVTAPDVTAPDVTAPDVTAVGAQIPDVTAPDVTAPDVTAPDVTAPDVTAPDVTAIPPGGELTDTLVKVKNKSNVATSFSVKTFLTKPLPAGFKLQILATQPYYTVSQKNCAPVKQVASALVANIPSPAVVTDVNDLNFNPTDPSAKELTIALPPGGDLIVDYRLLIPPGNIIYSTDAFGRKHAYSPDFNPAVDIVPVPIPESVSTNVPFDPNCGTEGFPACPTPVVPLTILTTSLPNGVVGQRYPLQTLSAVGGTPPYTWNVTTGTLPAGLTLTGGQISGTPIVSGVFSFTVQVTDSSSPARQMTRNLSITIPQTNVLYGVNSGDDGLSVIDPTVNPATAAFIARLDPDTGLRTTPVAMAVRSSDQTIFVWNNSNAAPATDGGELLTVDRCTGLAAEVNPSAAPQAILGALAYRGAELFGADTSLYRINVTNGVAQESGQLGLRVGGMDFNSSGVLYGVELNFNTQRLVIIDTNFFNPAPPTIVATLSQDIGIIGSIVFSPSGTLIGSGDGGPQGNILFDINPANGVVSNVRPYSGGTFPQGLGYVPACPGALTITTTSLPGQLAGSFYSERLQAGLGSGGRVWSVTAGALPPGLTLDAASGRISGTPSTIGTYSFTVRVQDSAGQFDTKALSISITTIN